MPDEPTINPDIFEHAVAPLLSGQKTDEETKFMMLMSIAISLKRIADSFEHQNQRRWP